MHYQPVLPDPLAINNPYYPPPTNEFPHPIVINNNYIQSPTVQQQAEQTQKATIRQPENYHYYYLTSRSATLVWLLNLDNGYHLKKAYM
jgi:hypothetical protein